MPPPIRSFLLLCFVWAAPVALAQSAALVDGPDPREIPLPSIKSAQPSLPGVAALPVRAEMPAVLTMNDGTKITTPTQWKLRREEMKRTLEYYAVGRMPPPPGNVTGRGLKSETVAAGTVHYRLVQLSFGPAEKLHLDIGIFTPAQGGPFPAIISPARSPPGATLLPRLPARPRQSETLDVMQKKYPNWFSPHLHEFWGPREKLPFDQHWFLALCAPRPFITLEGDTDTISLPEAVRQSVLAAKPAYALFGANTPDRLGVNYAKHGHAFTADDWTAMMDFADHHLLNKKTDRRFDRFPTEAELDAAPAAARAARPAPAAAKQFPLP